MEIVCRILIVSAEGRKHVSMKAQFSTSIKKIYLPPGNSGTESVERCSNIPEPWDTQDASVSFAQKAGITLFIPSTEQWLISGLVDAFANRKLAPLEPFLPWMQLASHPAGPQSLEHSWKDLKPSRSVS